MERLLPAVCSNQKPPGIITPTAVCPVLIIFVLYSVPDFQAGLFTKSLVEVSLRKLPLYFFKPCLCNRIFFEADKRQNKKCCRQNSY